MIPLPVLIEWPYVEDVLYHPVVQSPWLPKLGPVEVSPVYVVSALLFSWDLIAIKTSVSQFDPQVDQLWGLAMTTTDKLLCRADPMKWGSVQWGYGTSQVYTSGMSFVELFWWCSCVVWRWSSDVLVLELLESGSGAGQVQLLLVPSLYLLSKTSSQGDIGHHLCQAWGDLMDVTLQGETGHHLCCAWGFLARATGHTEACHCLFGVYGPLRDFWKVCCMRQSRLRLDGWIL